MEFTYETIKRIAKETNKKVGDLIALAAQNDPFYQGTPATLSLAEWFADIYYRQGWNYIRNHIRRCHYQIVSLGVQLPNGKPYENTEECWGTLLIASKAARYLQLVDIASFDDRRNDEPLSYVPDHNEPGLEVYGNVYTSDLEVPDFPFLPSYALGGYHGNQRYHLEIWCEKTTMNDVLEPLCRAYGAVLQTGAGELSITAARLLSERLQEIGKPTRIFYVSDFDPAGQSMPVAVSRKLEYFIRNGQIEADVRLFPVVLTAEQVRGYHLPRTPIKETERRRTGFEGRYGEGAVELDALEALHPGELERVMRRVIERYYDTDLANRVTDARQALEAQLRTIRDEVLAQYRDEIEATQEELEQIRAQFGPRMEVYGEHVRKLWQAISDDLQASRPDINAYPLPETGEADEIGEGLYNSQRDYLEQIDAYKAFQGK